MQNLTQNLRAVIIWRVMLILSTLILLGSIVIFDLVMYRVIPVSPEYGELVFTSLSSIICTFTVVTPLCYGNRVAIASDNNPKNC